ncbi:alkaline-phosphatase-like protein, partial [Cunninghamella echinulata]
MQRIKGLMTGSLPTFIDAGDNFASSSVHEDHLLVHLSKKYKQLYFMGDNTWEQLFSSVLATERTFASDSFKMFDLYTVDNRIQEQLWPLLEKEKKANNNNNKDDNDDWEVVITHFLGVDHCGHTYGPNHSNMAIKLDEMNTILSRLINNHVDNQTLLVVMGDHGMSTEGDHGGESVEELMSGVLFYSGRKLTTIQQQKKKKEENDPIQLYFKQLIEKIYRERTIILGHDLNKITERLFYNANDYSIVPQINLVPTLSYLLQLPIPFGNLGALIPEVLLHHDQPHLHQLDILLHMAQQYRLNALQVYDYLMTYGNQTHHIGFTKEALTSVLQQLEQADKSFLNAINIYSNFHQQQQEIPLDEKLLYIDSLEATILGYDAFLSTTIKYCEGIWAQFDVGCMFLGIFILFSSTLAAIYIWLQHDQWQDLTWYQWKQVFIKFISSSCIQVLISGMMLCVILVWVTLPIVHLSNPTWHGAFEKIGELDLFSSMIVNGDGIILFIGDIIQASTLGSNSFVIWEDRGTRFIIITLCVWWLHRRMKFLHDNSEETNWLSLVLPPFLVMVWVRMTGVFGQCREEQFPYCSYI